MTHDNTWYWMNCKLVSRLKPKVQQKKKKTFKTFGKTFFKSIWKKMLIRFCLLSFLSLKFDKVTTINRIIWKKESFANTPPGKNFDKRLFCKQSGVFENLYVFLLLFIWKTQFYCTSELPSVCAQMFMLGNT